VIDGKLSQSDILEKVLLTIKSIDEMPVKIEGYTTFFKQLANLDPRTAKGSIHTIREIEAGGIPLNEIKSFETGIKVPELPPTPKTNKEVRRKPDAQMNDLSTKELKDAEEALNKLQFVKDILISAKTGKFPEWILRGSEEKVKQVQNQMLKMLGENGGKMDNILDEVIDKMTDEQRQVIYQHIVEMVLRINAGEIVRKQSY
jgi:replicative superfamily II helicase